MWIEPLEKSEVERLLFHFFLETCKGPPRAKRPLVMTGAVFRSVIEKPHPDLVAAYRHCLGAFLTSAGSDHASWGKFRVPPDVFTAAIAHYNYLSARRMKFGPSARPDKNAGEPPPDPALEFTQEITGRIAPAVDKNTAIALHTVLRGIENSPPEADGAWRNIWRALMELSPLTALWSMDVHTPEALVKLAPQFLTGWDRTQPSGVPVWPDDAQWNRIVSELTADPHIGRMLRRRWLAFPETRTACRNTGLVLEMLRRSGNHREFILEYYEGYEFFNSEKQPYSYPSRNWPVLETIERLLRFPGDTDTAMQVNRRGNEYFLKFRPLLEFVIEENGVPKDFKYLTPVLVDAIRPLVDLATFGGEQGLGGRLEFESQ